MTTPTPPTYAYQNKFGDITTIEPLYEFAGRMVMCKDVVTGEIINVHKSLIINFTPTKNEQQPTIA